MTPEANIKQLLDAGYEVQRIDSQALSISHDQRGAGVVYRGRKRIRDLKGVAWEVVLSESQQNVASAILVGEGAALGLAKEWLSGGEAKDLLAQFEPVIWRRTDGREPLSPEAPFPD